MIHSKYLRKGTKSTPYFFSKLRLWIPIFSHYFNFYSFFCLFFCGGERIGQLKIRVKGAREKKEERERRMNGALALLLALLITLCTSQQEQIIKLGCIYPFSKVINGNVMKEVVEVAAREVNDRRLIPNYNISVVFRY